MFWNLLQKEKPPNWEKLITIFPVDWDMGVIVTYGSHIYCKYELREDKLVHERTHIKQQKEYGVEKWWERYYIDREFRLAQELEAYKNEAEWVRENITDRNKRHLMIRRICIDLSSPMYGNLLTRSEALNKLS
jgi:hypothetical protein